MATLMKIKKKSGSVFHYSQIRSVKWTKSMLIPLDTSSKTTANIRHSEVNRFEKIIKGGQEVSWTWENDNEEGITRVRQISYNDAINRWLENKKHNI